MKMRTALGLSQEAMARMLGVSFTSVSRWEGERSLVPSGLVLDVYKALHVALSNGLRPETILAGLDGDRGMFLLQLFTQAYGGTTRRRKRSPRSS